MPALRQYFRESDEAVLSNWYTVSFGSFYPKQIVQSNLSCDVCSGNLLRTVPTNLKVFLRGFIKMREKQISTSVIKIQKENWG